MNLQTIKPLMLILFTLLSPGLLCAAPIMWTNTSGGNWSEATNWDPNQLPGAADTAVITNEGTYTVIVDVSTSVGSFILGGESGNQTLTNGGSIFTLGGSSIINRNGVFGQSGIQSGGSLDGSIALTIEGVMNWSGGNFLGSLLVASNGILNLDGSGTKSLYGPLTNAGAINWSDAGIISVNPQPQFSGRINNLAGGVFNIHNDQNLYGNGEVFRNAGTVLKLSGSGITYFTTVPFDNTGTVRAEAGTINFAGGGDFGGFAEAAEGAGIEFGSGVFNLTGTFTAGIGAVISLAGGSFICSTSLILDGAGIYRMTGGQIALVDGYIPDLQMLGGTASMTLTPAFQGGAITNLTLNSITTLVGDYTVSGILNCDAGSGISGNVLVNDTGTLNWHGASNLIGSFTGSVTVASNAVLNLEGPNYKALYAPLTNAGTVNWSGTGGLQVFNTGVNPFHGRVFNLAGGVFNILNDQNLYNSGSAGSFDNAGIIRKSSSPGATFFDLTCTNRGTVSAETGTIHFYQGYTATEQANFTVSLGGSNPGNDYGHIRFTNALAAVGTFTVTTQPGFRPNPGDTFQVLSYESATNEFTCINGLDLGEGLFFIPQFGLTNLALLTATYDTNNILPELFLNATPASVTVTWPIGLPDWVLQSTTNLAAPQWVPVPVQCNNQAIVPISSRQQYFRLIGND